MPLAFALIVYLGSFLGYMTIQSGTADQTLTYLQSPVTHDHQPWAHQAIDYLKKPTNKLSLPAPYPVDPNSPLPEKG